VAVCLEVERASPSMLRSALSSVAVSVLGVAVGFVSVPVMLSGLGYTDYGAYSIAFTVAGYGAFLDLGFGWAGMRFVAEAHARQDREAVVGVLWALVLYQAAIGGAVLVLLVVAADRLGHWLVAGPGADAARIAAVLPIAGVWFAISGLNGIFLAMLRGVGRYGAAAVVAGTMVLLGVGGGALLVGQGHGLRAAALCQVGGALAAAGVAVVALRDLLGARLHGPAASAGQLRRMVSFSLWSFLSRLVQVAIPQGDKVIVARVSGATGLGA
jgi:O-antigen/teichoic acid export membrane protein